MQTQPNPSARRVYIVEDSAPIRARLAEMLATLPGLSLVGEAASARDAVAGIRRTRPDAVLLDLNLMGATGLDVLRAVRTETPETLYVVLTNHSESQYQRACVEAGADHFLDKSTELGQVREILSRIAGQ